MPADIALPISVSTNTPDVDLGAGRDSVVNQSVGDKRQAFNQEYQRQVDARQADIRADERASQRADREADRQAGNTRRVEQNRRDEQISQAERRNQQQESGKRLPDNRNSRAEELSSQKTFRQDQAKAEKSRIDNSQREGAERAVRADGVKADGVKAEIRQELQANSQQAQQQQSQTNQLDAQQQSQKAQQLQYQNSQQASADKTLTDSSGEGMPVADDVVLPPYILQQLSDTDSMTSGEVANTLGDGSDPKTPMSTLTQWMEQTLGGASNESAIVVDKGVDKGVTENTPQEDLKAAADTLSVPTSKTSDVTTLEAAAKLEGQHERQSEAVNIVESKTVEPKAAEAKTANVMSTEALRSMDDVARLLDAKRPAENPLEKALPGSKILPLSQAIESINRSDRLAEPTFLKQTDLSSDEVKQLMQERKVLLEGGRLEGGKLEGAVSSKAGGDDVMTSQADKLLALDKRLSQGMEGLRQLRIPGQDAKKTSVDDSVKSSSFGRALEQMSSIKTEEVKPLSTSIATPLNKPGFIPEFNQRIMMMIGQKIQEAEIKLNPAELGSIDVSIKFNQDQQASIVFASQHSVTRDALEQGAQRLRDMLEQNGVDVDSVDIQENLTHDRHDKGNDDERGLAASAKDQDGVSDDTEAMDGRVVTIETDSLVDFYA